MPSASASAPAPSGRRPAVQHVWWTARSTASSRGSSFVPSSGHLPPSAAARPHCGTATRLAVAPSPTSSTSTRASDAASSVCSSRRQPCRRGRVRLPALERAPSRARRAPRRAADARPRAARPRSRAPPPSPSRRSPRAPPGDSAASISVRSSSGATITSCGRRAVHRLSISLADRSCRCSHHDASRCGAGSAPATSRPGRAGPATRRSRPRSPRACLRAAGRDRRARAQTTATGRLPRPHELADERREPELAGPTSQPSATASDERARIRQKPSAEDAKTRGRGRRHGRNRRSHHASDALEVGLQRESAVAAAGRGHGESPASSRRRPASMELRLLGRDRRDADGSKST